MLDLLRRREMPPAGRELGNSRHVWEGDDSAVLGTDAELALSLKRGACHRLGYVARTWYLGKQPSRARV